MPELSEFEGLGCPASAAREALSQMLDDNPNPHRVQFAPRAYLELLREGAEPWAVLACWRRRRRQAGRRDPLFQPQLAAWLAAPASDPKGARAALSRMAEREAARENAARSAAAGELYALSEEFRAAYDEAHDPELGPMARAKAQARAHAMLERELEDNP